PRTVPGRLAVPRAGARTIPVLPALRAAPVALPEARPGTPPGRGRVHLVHASGGPVLADLARPGRLADQQAGVGRRPDRAHGRGRTGRPGRAVAGLFPVATRAPAAVAGVRPGLDLGGRPS